jgi:hypothetical protein
MVSCDASGPDVNFGPEMFNQAIRPLLDYRESLSPGLSPEVIRQKMREFAEGLGLEFKHGPGTWEDVGVSPEWLLDYVESQVGDKRKFEVADVHNGHFWFDKIRGEPFGLDFDLPVLIAIMTPFVSRKKVLADLDHAIDRRLQASMRMRPATLRKATRCLTLTAQGMTDSEIADLFLTEDKAFDRLKGKTAEQRHVEAEGLQRKEELVVRQLRSRLLKAVTEVAGLVSRD